MDGGYLRVYICTLPDAPVGGELACRERMEYVLAPSNEGVRRERYFVWRLLEAAVRDALGADGADTHYLRLPDGGWASDKFCFSLSHGGGALAVAISDMPVGIDIEPVRQPRAESFPARVLNEDELSEYNSADSRGRVEFLIRKWTEKESIFKRDGGRSFVPSSIRADDYPVVSRTVTLGGLDYSLAVCSGRVTESEICKLDLTI